MSGLALKPISIRAAQAFVAQHHRHHKSIQGAKFALSAIDVDTGATVGVAMVGRPSRMEDDGWTAEVTRIAVIPHRHRHACSMLLQSAKRAAQAMGYRVVRTRSLVDESGASLRGAGWKLLGETSGGSWHRATRPRTDKHPTGKKNKWVAP